MSIKQTAILMFGCGSLLLTSCTMTRILRLDNKWLPTKVDGNAYTQEEVQQAILRACSRRGWSGQVQGEDLIVALIVVRNYSAKVEIKHTNTTVSISYLDSHALDHSGNYIHMKYNAWVTNLYHAILSELGSRGQKR